MSKAAIPLAALLPALLMLAAGCGDQEQGTGEQTMRPVEPSVVRGPEVCGWVDVILPSESPYRIDADGERAWVLLDGGSLLCLDAETGEWTARAIEGAGRALDMHGCSDELLMLTQDELIRLDREDEVETLPLPEGFTPLALGTGNAATILGSSGEILIEGEEGLEEITPEEPFENVIGGLYEVEGQLAFLADEGDLVLVDPESGLYLSETVDPAPQGLIVHDGALYAQSGSTVMVRNSPGVWESICEGRLYEGALVMTADGVFEIDDTSEPIASTPALEPERMVMLDGDLIVAMDSEGLLAYSALGRIESRLPRYDLERISCSLAGQSSQQDVDDPDEVGPVVTAASGAFRIYESVSSRPDPFTEFPATRRDLRRPIENISVEELRLVGITLDPVGGDQAMVEDANGVSYILYEETELANNTHVAEITSNEVVVVQEVTIDYGPDRGGEASIPTIYTMRLHEEGGL